MLPFYRKYLIATVALAVLVSVVVSTAWASMTGTIMAASLPGLVAQFVLFFGTLFAAQFFFSRKATAETEAMVRLYDQNCDPQAFIDASDKIAHTVTAPYGEAGSWFASLYGQALLDLGKTEDAHRIEQGMRRSIELERKPHGKAAVATNFIPFAHKVSGPEKTLALTDEALGYLSAAGDARADAVRSYVETQRDVALSRVEGRTRELFGGYAEATRTERVPMRLRVESAWEAAKICYADDELKPREREFLQFIVDHGNKLALVTPAKARLAALG